MGIKKLYKYLSDNKIIKYKQLSEYNGKKVAIDISILLYQLVISIRNSGDDLRNKKGEVTSHILGLFNKTIWLINNNIIPVYIFDGKPPAIKKNTLNHRRNIRAKAKEKEQKSINEEDRIKYFKRTTVITTEQMDQCKELLHYMGVPYFQAEGEADILCAQLCKYGYVDAVSTEDMDILTFGSINIVKNIFSRRKQIEEICLEDILSKLKMSQDKFIRFCIFLGCDYNIPIKEMNFDYAKKLTNKYSNDIELKNGTDILPSDFSIDLPYQYFVNQEFNLKNIHLKIEKPNDKLLDLLVKNYGLIKHKILWKINLLKNISPV